MKKLLVVAVTLLPALGSVALSAEGRTKARLNVYGAVRPNCAKALAAALVEGGVKKAGKIDPKKSKEGTRPVRIVGEIAADADLGAIGKAVNAAKTPHKGKSAPGVALVLFAKLNKESAGAARKALRNVKGVDGKSSRANAKAGVISAKISGKEKVTVANILAALKEAGIEASLTRPKKE